jgi:hypothetical protein
MMQTYGDRRRQGKRSMRCAVLFGLGLVVSVAQAHAQTSSESMGVSETGEIVSIDTKTIRTVKYPKMSPGDPQMASYREAWTRVTKEGKLIGQFLWLFDCQGNFVCSAWRVCL